MYCTSTKMLLTMQILFAHERSKNKKYFPEEILRLFKGNSIRVTGKQFSLLPE